jgi:leader peptidase (prepilin peptidase)/N-methyltransferase
VEVSTAVIFGVVGWKFRDFLAGIGQISVLLAFLYFAAISVALALIDLDTHTLPNWIVLPSYAVGVVLLTIASLSSGTFGPLLRALLAAGVMWIIYLAIALSYPGGMGFGDVKFAGVLGLFLGYLGWTQVVTGAIAAFVLGAFFAIGLLIGRSINRKSGIPFGPWMMLGAWVGVLFSTPIAQGYLSLMGLNSNV